MFHLAERSTARPLELIYSHCLSILNISSENNDFGIFLQINFKKKSYLNALGSKFDLEVK